MGMIVFYAWTCEGGEVDHDLFLSLSSTMHAGKRKKTYRCSGPSRMSSFLRVHPPRFGAETFWILRRPAEELCALRVAAWRVGGSNDTLGWRMHSLPTVV